MADEQAVVHKVLRRLIPFGVLCYLMNYVDRVNISVAKLKMVHDARAHTGLEWFTEDVYSIGAGIFFLGYFLFELPSNLIMEKVGARRWMARIMISWGIITMCFVFTRGVWSFYGFRFGLGLAEAGFFPGMVLYLSYWMPQRYRARAAAMFLTSTALAGVIGNPLGGLITYLTRSQPLGIADWQWLFLLEGFPSVLLGLVTLLYLTDRPKDARWLNADERATLIAVMKREEESHPAHGKKALADALASPHMWILSLLYGLMIFGFYMVNFYTPTIFKTALTSGGLIGEKTPAPVADLWVCLFSAIPFGAAAVGMVLIGRHSDKHQERKYHLAFACGLIVVGMVVAALGASVAGSAGTVLVIGGLSVGAMGAFGMFGPFWALPNQFLTGTAVAAAFAIINSIGNLLGGYLGPMLKSYLGMQQVLLLAAGLGACAMALTLAAPLPRRVAEPEVEATTAA
ncbi:MAG TPA: MFS transporter [Phycisphaerae bacterium]|jgi:ACS family tartrate transporter-like MFS transporter|nr:MFS transporter [Phycisphaerae bacterium]